MTKPADPLVEQLRNAAQNYHWPQPEHTLEGRALDRIERDNDRTAMLVEALREAERALATVVEGDPMGCGKNSKCEHGRYGFEGCEACTDAVLDPALEAVRAALRVQEAHGGEHYPDIQRLQLGKQEDAL